jgi:cytochrome bd-type quinol oxidase subunit 2
MGSKSDFWLSILLTIVVNGISFFIGMLVLVLNNLDGQHAGKLTNTVNYILISIIPIFTLAAIPFFLKKRSRYAAYGVMTGLGIFLLIAGGCLNGSRF